MEVAGPAAFNTNVRPYFLAGGGFVNIKMRIRETDLGNVTRSSNSSASPHCSRGRPEGRHYEFT